MLRALAAVAALAMLTVVPASAASATASSSSVTYVGHGTARSCTPAALAKAVRGGGTVKFRCGPKRVTITLDRTLVVCNTTTCKQPWADRSAKVVKKLVLDGGNKVVLSGANKRPILYAYTCQESFGWLDAHCDTQTTPHIVVKNLVMQNGNATKAPTWKGHRLENLRGGGAIAMRGGHLTVQHVTFRDNRCVARDSDAGGGAVRLVGQRVTSRLLDSTFVRNRCANGGAVSSLQAPMLLSHDTFTHNVATGSGASSGKGGNGGAVYFDGTKQAVTVDHSTIQRNRATEGGPGIFYVSNDRTGTLKVTHSKITKNTGASFWTGRTTSIFFLGKKLVRSGSTIS